MVLRFYQLIAELKAKLDCAIVLVSHDHVVMSASDRVICLNGHICCEGTPSVVSSAPEYRALFGTGTQGALALYQHQHDHVHDETCSHVLDLTMFAEFMIRAFLSGLGAVIPTGVLGCFVIWRRMVYFGDALSHAAILGVVVQLR